jgi:iron-sulfur cluster repair protein YtfE (RIC family)
MKSTAILDLMVKDHLKIIKLLSNVEIGIGTDKISTMKAFDKFKWELEKHIFVEEKAIFTSYEPEDITGGYAMVPELIKEHDEILNKLKVLRKNVKKRITYDFLGFKEILMNHKKFEEEAVYPKFDQELNESEKKVIIERISEIL